MAEPRAKPTPRGVAEADDFAKPGLIEFAAIVLERPGLRDDEPKQDFRLQVDSEREAD